MIDTRRLTLDRVSSSTRNAKLSREVIVGQDIRCEEGYILAVRILDDKANYNLVEDTTGRFIRLRKGEVLAGVLGVRNALRGYAGCVPESLAPGDSVHVLNLGGVLGECTSVNPDLGSPFSAEVLGSILTFPRFGDRVGAPATIAEGAIPVSSELIGSRPIIFVAGTCMDSGKTIAAAEIVRGLTRAGLRVAGVKLTGVSLRRDALAMLDAGAVDALTFNDAGVVSTRHDAVLPAARGLLNHFEEQVKPDVIVAELGDGILGEYGVGDILADEELMARRAALVVCAPDQVGAWGAVRVLDEDFSLKPTVITGPATDTAVGVRFVNNRLGLPAVNARRGGEELVGLVREAMASHG